jgi:hypothetical protein
METHVFQTKIRKRGYLELKNLPFKEADRYRRCHRILEK